MERSSPHEEERTGTFYAYHPCYFLQEALRALLKCLGIESETTVPQVSVVDPITNSPTSTEKSFQDAADPPSTTNQPINASSLARRGNGRRSGISHGSGPQHH